MKKHQHIAEVLRSARKSAGISQGRLGAKLGLHAQAISNIERGITSLPLRHMVKISKILDVYPYQLFQAMLRDFEAQFADLVKAKSKRKGSSRPKPVPGSTFGRKQE